MRAGDVTRKGRLHFLFLNIGPFLDHLFWLIFTTVAALVLIKEWGLSYAELIPYATPGFIAFGLFSLPSGWLALVQLPPRRLPRHTSGAAAILVVVLILPGRLPAQPRQAVPAE